MKAIEKLMGDVSLLYLSMAGIGTDDEHGRKNIKMSSHLHL